MSASDAVELKRRYEEFAKTLDYKTTACDYNLRELEIDSGAMAMADGQVVLDVGCGLGYAPLQYAERFDVEAHGIDYADNMIAGAKELIEKQPPTLKGSVQFQVASVMELPYEDNTFDVVTSSRCLMALLEWEKQKVALRELCRVLKPGGRLVLMEGTTDGLGRLNEARTMYGLDAIAADGRDRLFTKKFDEPELMEFTKDFFELTDTRRFGMYYFLTRVVHPLLVAPESPKYDARINEVALEIARKIPDFNGMGHLVAFTFTKPSS